MKPDEARRVAQETREDAEAYASPVYSTHDLADLIDALAGEVERLTVRRTRFVRKPQPDGTMLRTEDEFSGEELVEILESEASGYAEIIELKQRESRELSQRLEEAHEALRFYADLANNRPHPVVAGSSVSEVDYDNGAKARVALSVEREDEEGDD